MSHPFLKIAKAASFLNKHFFPANLYPLALHPKNSVLFQGQFHMNKLNQNASSLPASKKPNSYPRSTFPAQGSQTWKACPITFT